MDLARPFHDFVVDEHPLDSHRGHDLIEGNLARIYDCQPASGREPDRAIGSFPGVRKGTPAHRAGPHAIAHVGRVEIHAGPFAPRDREELGLEPPDDAFRRADPKTPLVVLEQGGNMIVKGVRKPIRMQPASFLEHDQPLAFGAHPQIALLVRVNRANIGGRDSVSGFVGSDHAVLYFDDAPACQPDVQRALRILRKHIGDGILRARPDRLVEGGEGAILVAHHASAFASFRSDPDRARSILIEGSDFLELGITFYSAIVPDPERSAGADPDAAVGRRPNRPDLPVGARDGVHD